MLWRDELRKPEAQALAALLVATSDPDELGIVVGFLIGEPRQGRFGIGWSSLAALDAPAAAAPELTVQAVDRALSDIAGTTGTGSTARRQTMLRSLFTRATPDEQRFLVALLTGELRQGALELREVTPSVPELVDLVRRLPCTSVVLDGETLALTDDGRPRSFQIVTRPIGVPQ